MIYICTNAEIIAAAISTTKEQDERLAAIGCTEHEVARSVADLVDLYRIADNLFYASPEVGYTGESSFRAWNGGRISQFHKGWGALLAYDEESELANVQSLSDAIDKDLRESCELEICELESVQ